MRVPFVNVFDLSENAAHRNQRYSIPPFGGGARRPAVSAPAVRSPAATGLPGPPEGPTTGPGMAYATLCDGPGYDVDHV